MIKLFTQSCLISFCLIFTLTGYSQHAKQTSHEPLVYEGSTEVQDVYSPALEGNLQGNPSTQPVKIYLPPNYEHFPNNKYPVVYLLHAGAEMDYNHFYSDFDLLNILNLSISSKTIVPMVIVTPNANTVYGGGCYTNSYISGNWEDYIVQDVMQHIENNYHILDKPDSRGLSGFSLGGYGTAKISMKHPSLFNSIGLIGPGLLDFEEEMLNTPSWKEAIITAAGMDDYNPDEDWQTRMAFAYAVAFAPDSTSKPIQGRFPYAADGVIIDSIWQKYLVHDPYTMLQSYRDSLLKLNAIQIYLGDQDEAASYGCVPFHQALLDNEIAHGYEIYSGFHNPQPVLDDLFEFFSEQLIGIVPTIRSLSDYYLENTDTLVAEMDMDGKLYIVPLSAGYEPDSIYKHQVATADALANEENEFQLSGLEFGKYRVFAVSSDSAVSNIPEEFCLVPNKLPPDLTLVSNTVSIGDSISVKISRDGKICLHSFPLFGLDTLLTASEIMNSSRLIESEEAKADTVVNFSTTGMAAGSYWIYGFDQYGIVTGPKSVDVVVTSTGPNTNSKLAIKLFPNPAKKMVTIQTSIPDKYDIAITSLNGQLLYNDRMEGPTHQIDMSSFEIGLYFITVRSKDYVRTEKIIKL